MSAKIINERSFVVGDKVYFIEWNNVRYGHICEPLTVQQDYLWVDVYRDGVLLFPHGNQKWMKSKDLYLTKEDLLIDMNQKLGELP